MASCPPTIKAYNERGFSQPGLTEPPGRESRDLLTAK
jgi:hypothetical protein